MNNLIGDVEETVISSLIISVLRNYSFSFQFDVSLIH